MSTNDESYGDGKSAIDHSVPKSYPFWILKCKSVFLYKYLFYVMIMFGCQTLHCIDFSRSLRIYDFVSRTKQCRMKLDCEAWKEGWRAFSNTYGFAVIVLSLKIRVDFVRQDRNEIYPKKNPHESAAWFVTEELLFFLLASVLFNVIDVGRCLRFFDVAKWLETLSPWKSFAARQHKSTL